MSLRWIDRAGVAHQLRPASDLYEDERRQLDLLRQQARYTAVLTDAGFKAPALSRALPNIMRMMLRILLPDVTAQELATFDPAEGQDLLVQWWTQANARAEQAYAPFS